MKKLFSKTDSRSFRNVFVKDFHKNKTLYFLFLPVLLYYIIFCYGPLYGTLIAFKDFSPAKGVFGSAWVGLKHFERFFSVSTLWMIISNTLRISIFSIIYTFPAPIILAILMNELKSKKFARLAQNATYLPHFISLVVICGIIKDFTRDTGVVTTFLSYFGFPKVTMLNYKEYFLPVYIISAIWQSAGWGSVIYLSALMGINTSLYEAAEIDGANKFKRLIHITLPGIAPTIITMLILDIGRVMNVGYEKILLLSNPAIQNTTEVISTYVYRVGLINHSYSYSTAVSMINSVINLALLIITNKISKKVSDTSLW